MGVTWDPLNSVVPGQWVCDAVLLKEGPSAHQSFSQEQGELPKPAATTHGELPRCRCSGIACEPEPCLQLSARNDRLPVPRLLTCDHASDPLHINTLLLFTLSLRTTVCPLRTTICPLRTTVCPAAHVRNLDVIPDTCPAFPTGSQYI